MSTPEDPKELEEFKNQLEDLNTKYSSLVEIYSNLVSEGAKSDDSSSTDISKRAERILKLALTGLAAVASAVSILYVFGFVIVNTHLANFGIKDYSFVKPTYLAAGVVFVIFHLLLVSFMLLVYFLRSIAYTKGELPRSTRLLYDSFLIVSLFGLAFSVMLGFVNLSSLTFTEIGSITIYVAVTYFIILMLILEPIRFHPILLGLGISTHLLHSVKIWWYTVFSVIACISLLGLWGLSVYPYLRIGVGSGRPVKARLVITDAQNSIHLEDIGIEVSGNVTEIIDLYDDTGKDLIVVLENGNAVKIEKSWVGSVLYITETTPTPVPTGALRFVTATPQAP